MYKPSIFEHLADLFKFIEVVEVQALLSTLTVCQFPQFSWLPFSTTVSDDEMFKDYVTVLLLFVPFLSIP